MIKIVHKVQQSNLPLNYLKLFLFLYKGYEDYFWTFYAKFFTSKFLLPTIEESLSFSIEADPSFCFKKNNEQLPFGAHGWYRYDLNFWLNTVDGLKETLTKNKQVLS